MKIRTKIILIQVIIAFIVVSIGLFLYFSLKKQTDLYIKSNDLEKNTVINTIFEMNKQQQYKYANDYSMWDDMVSFIKDKDPEWAGINIDESLATFGYDIGLVFDKNGSIVYTSQNGMKNPVEVPIPKDKLLKYLKNNREDNFFSFSGNDLVEYALAYIRPSDDIDKKTEPKGYYLVGKIWRKENVSKLEELTGYNIKIEKGQVSTKNSGNDNLNTTENGKDLWGWDKSTIGHFHFISTNKYINEIMYSYYFKAIVVIVAVLLLLVITYLLLELWVTRPIKKIINSLNSHDTSPIKELANDKTEFGMVATLVLDFEAQKEELVNAKNKAESANLSKSEFLANMSHEIRTPLNGIVGMTELLAMTGAKEDQKELIDMAKVSADSLLQIINDILDFSKIEAGKLELVKGVFDVRDLVEKTVNAFSLRAHEKALKLTYNINNEVPDLLLGDQGQLRQILVNLIGNAIKFTHKGEVVVIVEKEKQTDNEIFLRFSIKDTGIGIPENKLNLLFKSFSQVDSSYTKKYGGTGLGLTISKNLCELMNGSITVDSKENVGSTFLFTVVFEMNAEDEGENNLVQMQYKQSEIKEIKEENQKKVRILVVEDDYVNQRIIVKMLQFKGWEAYVVKDGKEALKAMEAQQFNIVLMDLRMQNMDGFEATAQIRENEKKSGSHIPIIAVTAHAIVGFKEKCLEAGMDDYISKPINPELLFDSINKFLI